MLQDSLHGIHLKPWRLNGRNHISEAFDVTNGVQQGSVLSPFLFNIYIDDVLNQLSYSGDGAKIANMYVWCMAYADDIGSVSPTVMALQRMLDMCTSFADSNGLTFNVSKSVVIAFVKSRVVCMEDPQLVLNNNTLPWKSRITHLGVILDELGNNATAWRIELRNLRSCQFCCVTFR